MIFNSALLVIALPAAVASVKASDMPVARAADVSCAQAARFGIPSFSTTTLIPGQTVSVTHDYTCSFYFGIPPVFTDYVIEVGANGNGHQAAILAARRTPAVTVDAPKDTFTVPFGFYLTTASYELNTITTYSVDGTDGSPVLQQGGVLSAVTISSA